MVANRREAVKKVIVIVIVLVNALDRFLKNCEIKK